MLALFLSIGGVLAIFVLVIAIMSMEGGKAAFLSVFLFVSVLFIIVGKIGGFVYPLA